MYIILYFQENHISSFFLHISFSILTKSLESVFLLDHHPLTNKDYVNQSDWDY